LTNADGSTMFTMARLVWHRFVLIVPIVSSWLPATHVIRHDERCA